MPSRQGAPVSTLTETVVPFTPTDTPGVPGLAWTWSRPGRASAARPPDRRRRRSAPAWAEANLGRRGRAGHTRSRHLGHVRHAHAGRARTATACHAAATLRRRRSDPRDSHDRAWPGARHAASSVAPTSGAEAARRRGGLARATCHLRARESATRPPARAVTAARHARPRTSAAERATRRRRRARRPRAVRPRAS